MQEQSLLTIVLLSQSKVLICNIPLDLFTTVAD